MIVFLHSLGLICAFALMLIMLGLFMLFDVSITGVSLILKILLSIKKYNKFISKINILEEELFLYIYVVFGRSIRRFTSSETRNSMIDFATKSFEEATNDMTRKGFCLFWYELTKPGKDQ